MKILVTGSNGLLGQKLTDYFKAQPEHHLIATSRGANRHPEEGGYTYVELNVLNPDAIEAVLIQYEPDVVIHTAAMTNVDACELDHVSCDRMNVEATLNLVRATRKMDAHFVHLSTDFIFDGTCGPLNEEAIPNPISYYGLSKWKAEEIVKEHASSWSILRTVLVYGVVSDMSRSNIVLWAKNNLEAGKSLKVVGDQFRTPTFAEDLAIGCALAAEKKAQGVFHISGKEFMSVFDLVYRVADFWQLDKNLLSLSSSMGINQPAKRPPITGFDISRAQQELGYSPRTLEEGMAIMDKQIIAFANKSSE